MIKKIKHQYRRFHSWMRYNPPGSMTWTGWKYFDREYKDVAPIRYYITRTFKKKYILPIKWKIRHLREWFRYRIFDVYHKLDTGLEPGYYGVSEQMLHVNFNMLKDFLEVEQAWSYYIWNSDTKRSWAERHMPFYSVFKPFRRPDIGLKYLEWASTLDDPSLPPHEQSVNQAHAAREMAVLYKWWMEDRPARVEIEFMPHKRSFSHDDILDDEDETPEVQAARLKNHSDREKQSEEWETEDEAMLIRLMKIRGSLWT